MTEPEPRRRGALPAEYTSFVDRRTQIVAARTSLEQTRLLTIIGPGGVGKTRFAIRLAQTVRRLYPDGCWFVDLSGLSATDFVADEVGRIVGASGTGDPVGALVRFFGTKRGLLVIDNCEHVIYQCAWIVLRILEACPEITVIATSRELLRVASETAFPIQPFESDADQPASSPAVALFLERCSAVLPDPSPEEREAIVEICRRLDGLPLAIELAAARVRVLTPVQLLDRLEKPLALLTGGARDAPGRQQTLRDAISWSYELCTEPERALWRHLSVAVGEWELGTAEWMSEGVIDDEFPLDVVQSLFEKSIISRRPHNGVVYYDMLETVRQFGREMTTPDELDADRARLRDWYLERLKRLDADWYGPNQAYWLALTRTELPNIRVALEYCIAAGDAVGGAQLLMSAWRVVWQAHGRLDEFYRWSTRIVAIAEPTTSDGCQLLTMLAALEVTRDRPDEAAALFARAEKLAEQLDDGYCRALVIDERGTLLHDSESPALYEAAEIVLANGANPYPARTNIEERLVLVEDSLGDRVKAALMREALIARAVRAGESYETSFLLLNSGMVAARRGEYDDAVRLLRQSLSLAQNLEDRFGFAIVQEALARVAVESQDFVRAATLLGVTDMVVGTVGPLESAFPGMTGFRRDIEDSVKAALGARAFEAAYADGVGMTETDGVAYALGARLPGRSSVAPRSEASSVLTARESQVSALVGQGLTDREVAERLVISRRTAEGHVANSLMKLGFTSRAQLAAWTEQNSVGSSQGSRVPQR